MKTLTLKQMLAVTLTGIALSAASLYAADQKEGTLNISVMDENGQLVQDAPVYIYGEHKTRFVGGKEIPGTTTMNMAAGTYRVSSAIVRKNGDYLDRYASNEAHVQVVEGDNTSIILTLKAVDNPMDHVDYAELRHIGISADVAQNIKSETLY